MKDVARDVPEANWRRLLQELKGLFGPAFEPALKAYGRSFAELIAQYEGFRVEVRDSFGFDDEPLEERAALLADTCTYLNDALETLKEFMAFIEYSPPGRGAVPAAKSVARDVRMAILKDVDGLTYRQIGERLGVPPPADFGYKGDHAAVRKMVGCGRKFLKAGLDDQDLYILAGILFALMYGLRPFFFKMQRPRDD